MTAKRLSLAVLCALLAGCVNERVALLHDEGGGVGSVVVLDPSTQAERGKLTKPDTQALLNGGAVHPRELTTKYGALLAALPPPPQVFSLYFVEGTTQLTPDSAVTLEDLRKLISPASDVQLIGNTDTTGDPASNDKLSLDRAIEVRAALVQDGLPVSNARVTGRGQRDLRVPTGPGVSEPANRRVDVIIR